MDKIIEYEKLLSHLPGFMKQFQEMKEIMGSEDIELSELSNSIQIVINNAFIEDCDETGIKHYELLVGVAPNNQERLELRKARVLSLWENKIYYTYKKIINKLIQLCGEDGFTVDADLKNYSLSFNLHTDVNFTTIIDFLDVVMPLNMAYEVRRTNQYSITEKMGISWQHDEIFELRQVIA